MRTTEDRRAKAEEGKWTISAKLAGESVSQLHALFIDLARALLLSSAGGEVIITQGRNLSVHV